MSQYANYERGGNVSSSPSRITWAVQRLILANIVVFAGQLIVSTAAGGFVQHWLEFRPADLLRGVFWTPLTCPARAGIGLLRWPECVDH